MLYPKIYSLYKRDEKTHKLIPGEYSQPEFTAINRWHVTEKVDGTNIRIEYANGLITIGGRTNAAEIPSHLLEYLQRTFTKQLLANVFPGDDTTAAFPRITLFGEGYGPKIQSCGGNYRKDTAFILFDVWVDGWWLTRENVDDIARKLDIPSVPAITEFEYTDRDSYGYFNSKVLLTSLADIISFVKSKPLSMCSVTDQPIEGVVCRSDPLMLFRDGTPIMFKLRCRDFV